MAKKKEAKKNEVAKVADAGLPAEIDFEEDAGIGQENMGTDDYAIPRLSILQALSPQLLKNKDEYIKGAEIGMIRESVANELFDGEKGFYAVPVSYRRTYIEWTLRENEGTFVADHGNDSSVMNNCKQDEKGRWINEAGNQIVLTAEYFIFMVDKETGAFRPFVLTMSSTQLKKSKRFNTMINQYQVPKKAGGTFNPAMFYRIYHFTTIPESNNKGDWFGWDIKGDVNTIEIEGGMNIYMAAKDLKIKIAEGSIKVADHESTGDVVEGEDDPM